MFGEKRQNFFSGRAYALGNAGVDLALLTGDVLHIQAVHIAQPEAAKLLLGELATDADHRFGAVPLLGLLFDPPLDDDLRPIGSTGCFVQRRRMLVLCVIALFLVVIVFVGSGFPSEEIRLRIKIGAGQTDDPPVGVGVNDGVGGLLVERVTALFVVHDMYLHSNFFGEI